MDLHADLQLRVCLATATLPWSTEGCTIWVKTGHLPAQR